MSIIVKSGASGNLAGVGAEAASGLHTIVKPLAGLGHFRVARRFVPAATTLGGILWTVRNPTASGLVVVVKRVLLRGLQVGVPTAAVEDIFTLKVARAYTTADATGSVSIAPAAAMQKMRTSQNNAVAQVREANVAAGASGGIKTEDTDAISTGSLWVVATTVPTTPDRVSLPIFDYYPNVADGEHPIALAADEGLTIRNTNAFGAASGIILHLELYWAEATTY